MADGWTCNFVCSRCKPKRPGVRAVVSSNGSIELNEMQLWDSTVTHCRLFDLSISSSSKVGPLGGWPGKMLGDNRLVDRCALCFSRR